MAVDTTDGARAGYGQPTNCSKLWYPDELRNYQLVDFGGAQYLCQASRHGFACNPYSGGRPPLILSPSLYCLGYTNALQCSTDWYPNELARYEQVTIGSNRYLCTDAILGSYGDFDCTAYTGGDPAKLPFGPFHSLKCTRTATGMTCNESNSYYPSELHGYRIVQIDFENTLCQDSVISYQCWRWDGHSSPKSVTRGFPTYVCDHRGCVKQ